MASIKTKKSTHTKRNSQPRFNQTQKSRYNKSFRSKKYNSIKSKISKQNSKRK